MMIVASTEPLFVGKTYRDGYTVTDVEGVPHRIPFKVLRAASYGEYCGYLMSLGVPVRVAAVDHYYAIATD